MVLKKHTSIGTAEVAHNNRKLARVRIALDRVTDVLIAGLTVSAQSNGDFPGHTVGGVARKPANIASWCGSSAYAGMLRICVGEGEVWILAKSISPTQVDPVAPCANASVGRCCAFYVSTRLSSIVGLWLHCGEYF